MATEFFNCLSTSPGRKPGWALAAKLIEVRYVRQEDPLRQALLEIYAAIILETPYNDFNTH